MEKRPIIGISASRSEENGQLILKETYFDAILRAGGLPVALPCVTDEETIRLLLDGVDGLLLSGGGDIHPGRYGEDVLPGCGKIDEKRDAFELTLTRMAVERGMPVLGICRGIQVLAVALGGTLFQDLASQLGLPAGQHMQQPPYDDYKHAVRFEEHGLLARITGTTTMLTNSMHHQAIRDAGPNLIIEGITMDGIVEAVSLKGSDAVFGVEFHPEHLTRFSDAAERIFAYLVKKAAAYGA